MLRKGDALVTAVYQLDPGSAIGGRGRPFDYYLHSLRSIAQVGAGLIVYVDPADVERLERHLKAAGVTAQVRGRALTQLPWHDAIQALRVEQGFRQRPERDRCHVLYHAKIRWLAEAARDEVFAAERYYWIDAGLAYPGLFPRRYLGDYYNECCRLFTPALLAGLAAGIDVAHPLLFLALQPPAGHRIHGIAIKDMQAWVGEGGAPILSHIVGGLFGGARAAVLDLHREARRLLVRMLADRFIGTEENVLTVLYHRAPERARLLPFTIWQHEDSDIRQPGPGDVPFYRIFERLAAGVRETF